jgi:hypothetical protein
MDLLVSLDILALEPLTVSLLSGGSDASFPEDINHFVLIYRKDRGLELTFKALNVILDHWLSADLGTQISRDHTKLFKYVSNAAKNVNNLEILNKANLILEKYGTG